MKLEHDNDISDLYFKTGLLKQQNTVFLHIRCGPKRMTVNQKYAFIKKSTIFNQSL